MLTPDQETELRRKADRGICHVNGCENPGQNKVQITFVTEAPGKNYGEHRKVQAVIPAWACGEHR